MERIQLNIGCGTRLIADHINIDAYPQLPGIIQADAMHLPYDNHSVDRIVASHLIEHFDFQESWVVLKEWYRVLKFEGELWIETPHLLLLCRELLDAHSENERVELYAHFFAKPWMPGETHKFMYTPQQLHYHMTQVGFKDVIAVDPIYSEWPKRSFAMHGYKK